MYINYDAEVDALAVQFTDGAGRKITTRQVGPGIYLDFDPEGHLVALEMLDASVHIPRADLEVLPTPVRYLTPAEAAEESGLSPVTLRIQIRKGRLHAIKRGRDWLITETDLVNYLESREASGRPATNPKARSRVIRKAVAKRTRRTA